MSDAELKWEGREDCECGEHATTNDRTWCLEDKEWCYPDAPCRGCELPVLRAEVERLRGVVGLAKFPENHLIWPDDHFAPNMWVAVPKPRFEALRAALAELEGKG